MKTWANGYKSFADCRLTHSMTVASGKLMDGSGWRSKTQKCFMPELYFLNNSGANLNKSGIDRPNVTPM
jgi:hypothetical protein